MRTGSRHSPETRAKLVVARRAQGPTSPETRARMSASHRGMRFSDEHRRNISLSRRAQPTKGPTPKPNGYVNVGAQGYEHRLVMERHLGRSLVHAEQVHHINGDRADNRLENLLLFATAREHHGYHAQLRRAQKEWQR